MWSASTSFFVCCSLFLLVIVLSQILRSCEKLLFGWKDSTKHQQPPEMNDARLHQYLLCAIWLAVLDRHTVCQWLTVRQLQCALSLGESSILQVFTVITLHACLTFSVNGRRTLSAPAELFHRSSICFWLLLFNSFCFRLNGQRQRRIKPFFRIIYKPIIYGT